MSDLLNRLAKVAVAARTPLGLAGLALVLTYALAKEALQLKIFANVGGDNTYRLLNMFLQGLFVIAIVSIVLAMLGYLFSTYWDRRSHLRSEVSLVDAAVAGHVGEDRKSPGAGGEHKVTPEDRRG
jgi:sterol desaturase/sphingolipid hydroxylase (fatty acid hydroxylase superfamily)